MDQDVKTDSSVSFNSVKTNFIAPKDDVGVATDNYINAWPASDRNNWIRFRNEASYSAGIMLSDEDVETYIQHVDRTTGDYKINIDSGIEPGLSGSTEILKLTDVGDLTTNKILVGDGLFGTPSITFESTTDMGLFRSSSTQIGISTGGFGRLKVNNNELKAFNTTYNLGASSEGFNDGYIARILAGLGSAASPSITFESKSDTGFYQSGNDLFFTCGGVAQWRTCELNLRPINDSVYGLGSDTNRWLDVFTDNIDVTDDVTLDSRSAYNILHLNSSKQITGTTLNTNQLLIGTSTDPDTISVDDIYQNKLGSKFNELNTSTNDRFRLYMNGRYIDAKTSTLRARSICVNHFIINSSTLTQTKQRFGFLILGGGGANSCSMGFGPVDLSLTAPLNTETGVYTYSSNDGKIYENGVNVSTVATSGFDDYIEYEIQTDDSYLLFKNSVLLYTGATITGTDALYYPHIADVSASSSAFEIQLLQSYDAGLVESKIVESQTVESQTFYAAVGSASLPTYTFIDNEDMGMYRPNGTSLAFSTAGTGRIRITANEMRPFATTYNLGTSASYFNDLFITQVKAEDGSESDPSYTFDNETDVGFYRPSSNNIGVTIAGNTKADFASSTFRPEDDVTYDLGSSVRLWRDAWIDDVHYNSLSAISDRRHKNNIADLTLGLNEVMKMRAVSFKYNERNNMTEKRKNELKENGGLAKKKPMNVKFGLIAQEVETALFGKEFKESKEAKGPCLHNESEDIHSLAMMQVIPILIKSIQDLKILIDKQQQLIDELR
jgi:hypothetical protein